MAAISLYSVSGVGSDTNSGSTVSASPKANGTGAATTAASAVVDLSADSPDLSAVVVGDTIRLNGRAGGTEFTGELVGDGGPGLAINGDLTG